MAHTGTQVSNSLFLWFTDERFAQVSEVAGSRSEQKITRNTRHPSRSHGSASKGEPFGKVQAAFWTMRRNALGYSALRAISWENRAHFSGSPAIPVRAMSRSTMACAKSRLRAWSWGIREAICAATSSVRGLPMASR